MLSKLTQIHFNSTNFINARLTQRVFCLTRGPTVVGEMEMHNLATLQTPLATFFPFKKAPKPYLVSENCQYCRPSARSCFPSARTHTPLSLSLSSLSLHLLCSVRGGEGDALSVKHRYYVASLILHASIAEITAQLLSLSYVYLIHQTMARLSGFLCRLTSWKGRPGLVV